jgi:CDP-glucose 4,6-dehydratase
MKFGFWSDKRVFITGHTGFKGIWLCKWLDMLGARVMGYSLPLDEYSLFGKVFFSEKMDSGFDDVRDIKKLKEAVDSFQPEIVFHLAAQAIVGEARLRPVETFSTNLMGSVNLLNILRDIIPLKAIIVVTSDKVYENKETLHPYNETDNLGGDEPYAASKAAVELAVSAYRNAYFKADVGLTTARASNVYGGGDLHFDRLIPHLIRSKIAKGDVELRNPGAVRPWQYVLDLLFGYLSLAELLYDAPEKYSGCWNFGPPEEELYTVGEIFKLLMNDGATVCKRAENLFPEAGLLLLNSEKSRSVLGWRPLIGLSDGLLRSLTFYRGLFEQVSATNLMESEIGSYMDICGREY